MLFRSGTRGVDFFQCVVSQLQIVDVGFLVRVKSLLEFFGEESEVGLPGFLSVAVGDLLSGFTENYF